MSHFERKKYYGNIRPIINRYTVMSILTKVHYRKRKFISAYIYYTAHTHTDTHTEIFVSDNITK